MFTGIIEEMGTIQAIAGSGTSSLLTIKASKVLEDIHLGDSIAVNGVCLTVTDFGSTYFTADVMHETLNRSSLGRLTSGSKVNLERAMLMGGRFGGHIVSGHIDGTGTIVSIQKDDIAIWYEIQTSPSILKYIIEKGSITIDGISLTVASIGSSSFKVSIIPHTAKETTLSLKKKGSIVNLENDLIGKYVERLLTSPLDNASLQGQASKGEANSKITKEFLMKYGF